MACPCMSDTSSVSIFPPMQASVPRLRRALYSENRSAAFRDPLRRSQTSERTSSVLLQH